MNTESTNTIDITELKKIRNKKQISIEALADILKVSKDFIKHIESGAFDKLGAPTFVKGHVTNYCKALDLPIDVVIQQIPEQFLQNQSIKPSDAMGVSPLAKVRRKSNHLGKYTIGTALLGMLALSFYFVWDKWSLPKNAEPQSMSLTAGTSATEQKRKPNGKNITYSSMIPQVKLDNDQPQVDEVESSSVDDETSTGQEPTEAQLEDSESATDLITSSVDDDLISPDSLQQMAGYSIQLQLLEEAWVSIQTNEGDKLVHDLVGPGTYTYQTEKPVSFRIGNAKNSQIKINGNDINLQDHMKKDIVDFSWPIDPS